MSKTPVRLYKQEPKGDSMARLTKIIENAILRHPTLFLSLFMVLAMLLFIAIIFTVCGYSATESGIKYNAFDRII